MQRLTLQIGCLVLVIQTICFGQDQSIDVESLAEKFIKEYVVPGGFDGAPQAHRVIEGEKESDRSRLERLIKSANNARPLSRQEQKVIKAAESNPEVLQNFRMANSINKNDDTFLWKFQNQAEKERKLLELQIRKDRLGKSANWTRPHIPRMYEQEPRDGEVVCIETRRDGMTFAQVIDEDTLHVYLNIQRFGARPESVRFALHGLPEEVSKSVEVGRQVTLNVLVNGVERYESVSGVRTLVSLYWVDPDFIEVSINKHAPKLEPEIVAPRVFTSADGKFKISAIVQSVDKESVSLQKEDGSTVTVPLAKLLQKDSEWLRAYRQSVGPVDDPFDSLR